MPTKREFYLDQVKTIPGHTLRRPSAEVIHDGLIYACVEWGFEVNRPLIRVVSEQISQAYAALYSSQGVAEAQGRPWHRAEGLFLSKVTDALNAVAPFLKTPAIVVKMDGRTPRISRRIRISGEGHKEILF